MSGLEWFGVVWSGLEVIWSGLERFGGEFGVVWSGLEVNLCCGGSLLCKARIFRGSGANAIDFLRRGRGGGSGGPLEAWEALGGSLEAPWRLPEGGAGGRGGGWGGSLEAWVRPGRLPGGSLRGERGGEAGGRLEAGWRQAVCTMAPVRVDASTLSSYR